MFCNMISCVGCTCGEVVWLIEAVELLYVCDSGTEGFTSSVEE